jgi:hypothetical protein
MACEADFQSQLPLFALKSPKSVWNSKVAIHRTV